MTDRIHVEDITQNHTPFWLLDADTQQRLRAWPHGVEIFTWGGWGRDSVQSLWGKTSTYRARPAPLVKPTVDWSQVGPAANNFARDKCGAVAGYEIMPRRSDHRGEWDTTSGDVVPSADRLFPSYRPGTVDWRDSLISRPEVEG